MGQNYILQFGQTLEPPYVQTDAAYAADSSRTGGWPAPEVVPQDFLNKLHLQGLVTASGLSQFVADNQTEDVVDTLTPAEYAALLTAAIQAMNFSTQAQFDNTTKTATTQFVQRALGSFAGASTYAVNTALTITDVGRVINAGATGLTFTLPATALVPDGSKIMFRGNGFANGLTVQRQGSDTIADGNAGDISYIKVDQWDVAELTKQGTSWYVTGGNEQLNTSTQFLHSKTNPGYIKLPGGIIVQWGGIVTGVGGAAIGAFPIPFPSACLAFLQSTTSVNLIGSFIINGGYAINNSQYEVFASYPTTGAGLSGKDISYIAIGY